MLRSILLLLSFTVVSANAATNSRFEPATTATNQMGLELFRALAAENPEGSLLISPYSIQSALALAYAGAAGETRTEMARGLHFPDDDAALESSFGEIHKAFEEARAEALKRNEVFASDERAKAKYRAKKLGADQGANAPERRSNGDAFELLSANRLFVQEGSPIRDSFRTKLQHGYDSTMALLDFRQHPEESRITINQWIEEQTQQKIRDLIPENGVRKETRMVLVNALYFKSPWALEFEKSETKPLAFHLQNRKTIKVPTMHQFTPHLNYGRFDGFVAVALPYRDDGLQFVILLPDPKVGLQALADKITPEILSSLTPDSIREQRKRSSSTPVELFLPKFQILSDSIPLSNQFKALGLKTIFDLPKGSANFDGIVPRKPDDYVAFSEMYHKTFIALDEKGTEAAAATALPLATTGIPDWDPPVTVRVDRPFLFMIQHCDSGICLFLGRVTDPR